MSWPRGTTGIGSRRRSVARDRRTRVDPPSSEPAARVRLRRAVRVGDAWESPSAMSCCESALGSFSALCDFAVFAAAGRRRAGAFARAGDPRSAVSAAAGRGSVARDSPSPASPVDPGAPPSDAAGRVPVRRRLRGRLELDRVPVAPSPVSPEASPGAAEPSPEASPLTAEPSSDPGAAGRSPCGDALRRRAWLTRAPDGVEDEPSPGDPASDEPAPDEPASDERPSADPAWAGSPSVDDAPPVDAPAPVSPGPRPRPRPRPRPPRLRRRRAAVLVEPCPSPPAAPSPPSPGDDAATSAAGGRVAALVPARSPEVPARSPDVPDRSPEVPAPSPESDSPRAALFEFDPWVPPPFESSPPPSEDLDGWEPEDPPRPRPRPRLPRRDLERGVGAPLPEPVVSVSVGPGAPGETGAMLRSDPSARSAEESAWPVEAPAARSAAVGTARSGSSFM